MDAACISFVTGYLCQLKFQLTKRGQGILNQFQIWLYLLICSNLLRQSDDRSPIRTSCQLQSIPQIQFGHSVKIDRDVQFESSAGASILLGDFVQLEQAVCLSSDSQKGRIILGQSVRLSQGAEIRSYQESCIEVGQFTQIGAHCRIFGAGDIKIGNNCHIGNRSILRASHLNLTELFPSAQFKESIKRGIVIEDNCWIGEGVCVLVGVTIGRGSIVGDEAVIADNIPPFSVVVGTPAKVLSGCLKDG